jgi:alpha-2-macroglobulin
MQKHYGDAEALAPGMPDLELPADATNQVLITKSGSGRMYWSARAVYYTSSPKSMKTGSAELNLLRDYFKLVPSKEGDKIVHRLEPFTGTAARGDVIAVRLTVTGTNWKYLMVEDPIPAGAEFIERDDLYELKEKPSWWTFWFTRREFHDDRAALFQTFFWKNQGQYFYLLKVVTPGVFRAGPARVEPMYQPGILATTEPKNMEVQ